MPRRGIWGWMLFDWAAQPFFTVVTTFIFGPYFVSRMASDPAAGQAAWGYGIAAAGFVIAILSPVLGSIADQTGPRKPWIGFFAVIQIVCAVAAVVRRARLAACLAAAVLLPRLDRRRILDRLQRFDDAAPGLQGRDRQDLEHRLGARLSRRHDRADLRRRLAWRPRRKPARRSSASIRCSGSIRRKARMRAPPGRCRRSGTSSSSCRCSCSRRMPARACRSASAVREGLAELSRTIWRGAQARPASSAS